MIESLTLAPPAGAPVPAALASAGAAGLDFAALLGTAAPVVATPVAEPVVAVAPVAPPLPSEAIELAPVSIAPGLPSPGTDLPNPPPAAGPQAASPKLCATTTTTTEPSAQALAAARKMLAGSQIPDEPVDIPTLPAEFVAQRAHRPAQDAEPDPDEAEAPADAQAPIPTLLVAPLPPAVPTAPPAAGAFPASVATGEARSTLRISLAPRRAAEAPDALSAASRSSEERTMSLPELMAAPVAEKPLASPPPPLQPVGAPALQADIGLGQPAPIAAHRAVVLDDLMVAAAPDSAWLDRLATDITTLARGDLREARIRLTPRSLGDMSVQLTLDGSSARVHFTVETPQALTLVADGAPKLAGLVQANGLKLDGATVDLGQAPQRDARQGQAPDPSTPQAVRNVRQEINQQIERLRTALRTDRFA